MSEKCKQFDYRTVTIEKDERGELGIYITGKIDSNGYLGYVVADLEFGGPAHRSTLNLILFIYFFQFKFIFISILTHLLINKL
jgi:hypothetical protein